MHGRKRHLTLCLTVVTAIVFAAGSSSAWEFLDPDNAEQQWAVRGLEALHNSDFATARQNFETYEKLAVGDPIAPLLFLKLTWWSLLEGRVLEGQIEREFEDRFEEVKQLSESLLKTRPDDVRALYALGEAYCCYGRLEGIRGHGWSTLQKHRKGVPYLKKVHALQPDLVAPLTSLGVFYYYASRAPGFLKFLAKFFSVEADRQAGLQHLFAVTRQTGLQQAEAAFFLLEILSNVEDDQLKALPIALRFNQKYPRGLGFHVSLATVQVQMERPDAAIRLLQQATLQGDAHVALAARFFMARALSMSGRATAAVTILESFTPEEFTSIEWLRAWQSYYLGVCYQQLGRLEEAKSAYRVTTQVPQVADSHGTAKRAMDRRYETLLTLAKNTEAKLSWDVAMDFSSAPYIEALEQAHFSRPETKTRAQFAVASLLLRKGQYSQATPLLYKIVRYGKSEGAWLRARPRIRLLQALLWSGRIGEAQELAMDLKPQVGQWGTNRQLELMIDSCLDIASWRTQADSEPKAHSGDRAVRIRFKDLGFSQVRVVVEARCGFDGFAMSHDDGYWNAVVNLAPGDHRYRFEIENGEALLDPVQPHIAENSHGLWSVMTVEPVPNL